VFLVGRRAPVSGSRAPAEADVCPETGRGRLSYPRAEYLFKQAAAAHDLRLLDFEGWGQAPAGFDAATLHSYSLLVPAIAVRVRKGTRVHPEHPGLLATMTGPPAIDQGRCARGEAQRRVAELPPRVA
jgi:hypothetical protein